MTLLAEAPTPSPDRFDAMRETLFRSMGAPGVYARTGLYEGVVEALAALISRHRPEGAEVLRLPPVMSRQQIERSGYLNSFPNLLGCMCCLSGAEPEIRRAVDRFAEGGDWTSSLSASDLVLTPAACYPLYPIAAARGPLPPQGLVFDVASDCFRREPSQSLDRMQSFRMREYVRIGSPEQIVAFREAWIERAKGMADTLALPYQVELASDPFFGRASSFLAASQIQQALKFELLIPTVSATSPTACLSFNYHRDHFGTTWDIRQADGEPAHTSCVAFGMDRLAIALFCTHGLAVEDWPAGVREALGV
ncbi:MAG: amino acid--[acyl-carrier-protein] ligase [Caulobacteraceae bacterium]